MLKGIREGGTFLLNSEWDSSEVFDHLTEEMQRTIIEKKIAFYNINALDISRSVGLGSRINTVMQAAFFKISGILPEDEAIRLIKDAIKKTFIKKGEDIVKMNWECVDRTSEALEQVKIPEKITKSAAVPEVIPPDASEFAREVIEPVIRFEGDSLPVSKMSFDGVIPTGTTRLEKRGIAPRVPRWLSDKCIQCNQCVMACPHGVVRVKQIAPEDLKDASGGFEAVKSKTKNDKDLQFRIQVYIEDCTGCGVCVETCPAKEKALEWTTLEKAREAGQNENVAFFESLPDNVTDGVSETTVKGAMFRRPLFEFSGACAGCGETPYVKLTTQLFGERMIIANATGCSSIYGGTFPTIPYCTGKDGRGPVWANSLFEDNAEYAFGMRLAVDSNRRALKKAVEELADGAAGAELCEALKHAMEKWDSVDAEAQAAQAEVQRLLPDALEAATGEKRKLLAKMVELQDYFVDKSIWAIGGDGWAYDIGFGGLDHVMAMGRDVNVLVLDTEVYSNTGGQASKATPLASVAKFASAGKRTGKKNMGLMLMSYGYVYVASVSMGANPNQCLKAFLEAEAYKGPSIILAYSPCIAHGIDMSQSRLEQKRAVEAGYYPLFRFNPADEKKFHWETKPPKLSFQDFIRGERRYSSLKRAAPEEAEKLFKEAEEDARKRMELLAKMAELM